MYSFIVEYGKIILSSGCIYIFIVIAIRLFGKKELSQLSVIDLVFILVISNSVQNALVCSNSTLMGGLISAGSLFIINYVFKMVIFYFPWFGRMVQGEAILLIYQGSINHKNMDKAKLTKNELMEAIREHGVASVDEVNLAILEIDGSISILSNEFQNKSVKKRKAHKMVTRNQ
jgi:uncharacterized membrane protein YcaP (DUF421 family)